MKVLSRQVFLLLSLSLLALLYAVFHRFASSQTEQDDTPDAPPCDVAMRVRFFDSPKGNLRSVAISSAPKFQALLSPLPANCHSVLITEPELRTVQPDPQVPEVGTLDLPIFAARDRVGELKISGSLHTSTGDCSFRLAFPPTPIIYVNSLWCTGVPCRVRAIIRDDSLAADVECADRTPANVRGEILGRESNVHFGDFLAALPIERIMGRYTVTSSGERSGYPVTVALHAGATRCQGEVEIEELRPKAHRLLRDARAGAIPWPQGSRSKTAALIVTESGQHRGFVGNESAPLGSMQILATLTEKSRELVCGPYVGGGNGKPTITRHQATDAVVTVSEVPSSKVLGRRTFMAKAACPQGVFVRNDGQWVRDVDRVTLNYEEASVVKWLNGFLEKTE